MTPVPGGPMLVEGPVEVVLEDGSTVRSDRFTVALCACRRSRRFPWCDTSHRRRDRPERERGGEDHGATDHAPPRTRPLRGDGRPATG